jgi:TP901 family phage tail tape measure protein
MATTLSALLNIKANVQGEGAVAGLGRAIGGLQGKAAAASGGLKALTSAAGMGGLGGAFSTLAPLLSGAGLIATGKAAVNAADDMNDLAQKTGASVETLSKLQQAANAGGTNIDAVGKALIKLNRGLGQLATEGKGPAADGLRALGISAKDARGNMLSADEIMLRVADKFKAMPDGAAKTAAAIDLFGKAGADMIPLLNGGRASIEGLTATMTTKFAKGADAANDKMAELQAKLAGVGAKLGEALLPAITALTSAVVVLVDGFGRLPAPLQQAIGILGILAIGLAALAPIITSVISLIGGLAGALPAVAGTLGAVVPALTAVGSAIGGFLAAAGALISWPVLLVAALVAAAVAIFVFRDKIAAFFAAIGQLIADWVASLWEWGEPIREFWVSIWEGLVDIAAPVLKALVEFVGEAFSNMLKVAYQVFFEPYVKLWEGLVKVGGILFEYLQKGWGTFSTWIMGVFKAIGDTFRRVFVDPITKGFTFVVETGKGALRGLLSWGVSVVNSIIRVINKLIDGINRVRSALKMSTFGKLSELSVPAFAEGGFVTGPTLGLVGEAGNEYIVPERKAAAFASNYLAGARGAAAIPTSGGGAAGGPASVTVNLTTGPVMQDAEGRRSVAIEEVERLVRQGVSDTIRQLRTPAGRYAMGVR